MGFLKMKYMRWGTAGAITGYSTEVNPVFRHGGKIVDRTYLRDSLKL